MSQPTEPQDDTDLIGTIGMSDQELRRRDRAYRQFLIQTGAIVRPAANSAEPAPRTLTVTQSAQPVRKQWSPPRRPKLRLGFDEQAAADAFRSRSRTLCDLGRAAQC